MAEANPAGEETMDIVSAIIALPKEIRGRIYNKLTDSDMQNLRHVCRSLKTDMDDLYYHSVVLDDRNAHIWPFIICRKIRNLEVRHFHHLPYYIREMPIFKNNLRDVTIQRQISSGSLYGMFYECAQVETLRLDLSIELRNPGMWLSNTIRFPNLKTLEVFVNLTDAEDHCNVPDQILWKVLQLAHMPQLKHVKASIDFRHYIQSLILPVHEAMYRLIFAHYHHIESFELNLNETPQAVVEDLDDTEEDESMDEDELEYRELYEEQLRQQLLAAGIRQFEEELMDHELIDEEVFYEEHNDEGLVNEDNVDDEYNDEELTDEEPVNDAPAADGSVAEEPVVEVPVAEQPVAEEPVAEVSVAEEPAAEEPVAVEPVAAEPVADEPLNDEPVAEDLVNDAVMEVVSNTFTAEEVELFRTSVYLKHIRLNRYPHDLISADEWFQILWRQRQLVSLSIDSETCPLTMDLVEKIVRNNSSTLETLQLFGFGAADDEHDDKVFDMSIFARCLNLKTLELVGLAGPARDGEAPSASNDGYLLTKLRKLPKYIENLSLTYFHFETSDFMTINSFTYFNMIKALHFSKCDLDWNLTQFA